MPASRATRATAPAPTLASTADAASLLDSWIIGYSSARSNALTGRPAELKRCKNAVRNITLTTLALWKRSCRRTPARRPWLSTTASEVRPARSSRYATAAVIEARDGYAAAPAAWPDAVATARLAATAIRADDARLAAGTARRLAPVAAAGRAALGRTGRCRRRQCLRLPLGLPLKPTRAKATDAASALDFGRNPTRALNFSVWVRSALTPLRDSGTLIVNLPGLASLRKVVRR